MQLYLIPREYLTAQYQRYRIVNWLFKQALILPTTKNPTKTLKDMDQQRFDNGNRNKSNKHQQCIGI